MVNQPAAGCAKLNLLTRTILFFLWGLSAWADRRPMAPGDLWLWRQVETPRISADGQEVVYVEKWSDKTHNNFFSNLQFVDSKGKQPRALTEGDFHDRMPRWSPDGTRVAFLSDRSGKVQIHVIALTPASPVAQVTRGDLEPLAIAWSPDGKSLAFTARVAPEAVKAPWAPPSILPLLRPHPRGPVQIFLAPVAGDPPQRLTGGELDYSGEPAWMPDGRSLVCAAAGQVFNIRVADHAVRELTSNRLANSEPVPSPDGSKIAWVAAEAKPQNYVVRRLWVMNADGGRVRMLSGALDRDVMDPQWSNDSRTVYFLADDRGSTHLYAGRNDGTARQVTTRLERLRDFSLADNGRAVTVRSTATEGGDVITFAADLPGGVVTLAQPNDRLMADRYLGDVEEIHYDSDGKSIQGWLVKPPHFDTTKKYPLLLDIRDAPRAMYGVEFQLRAQIFASAGYVVLCVNPRGTPGYGEEFGHLLRTRFPGDDADDLLRGVEYVLSKGYVDPKRVTMAGGLVAGWLLGHSDRFTAAVARHAIVDWAADVALHPDGARRAAEWMGGMPWDDPEQYMKRSPLFFASSFKTPTLVIAGDPDPESDQLFFALRQRKVESALMRIAGDAPGARVLELEAALGWLGR
jgi:dipeptidyl aminopeptidase/acylaminoacyl peptidase